VSRTGSIIKLFPENNYEHEINERRKLT
jgi:hypothetical protein